MNLALFDFDGTITTRETFGDFIYFSVPRMRLGVGKVLLAPMVVAYKLGLINGHLMRAAAVRIGLAGMDTARASELGVRFAAEALPSLLRPEVMLRIADHRAAGDRVIVVSGALELFLKPWCEAHGLEVIGSRLESRGGRLTGRYAGPQCVASEKVVRVHETLDPDSYEQVFAYGDTSDDFDLLRMAHHRTYRGHPWIDNAPSSSVLEPQAQID